MESVREGGREAEGLEEEEQEEEEEEEVRGGREIGRVLRVLLWESGRLAP